MTSVSTSLYTNKNATLVKIQDSDWCQIKSSNTGKHWSFLQCFKVLTLSFCTRSCLFVVRCKLKFIILRAFIVGIGVFKCSSTAGFPNRYGISLLPCSIKVYVLCFGRPLLRIERSNGSYHLGMAETAECFPTDNKVIIKYFLASEMLDSFAPIAID